MEVIINPSHFILAWVYLPLSSHSRYGTCSIKRLNPSRGTPTEDSGRKREAHTSTQGGTHSRGPFVGLAQQLLVRIATLAHVVWLAIISLFSYIGTFSPLISWPLPCNHLTELPPSSLHTTRMAPSPPSPEELPVKRFHEKPSATPPPGYRITFSRGRAFSPIGDSKLLGHSP